MSSTVPSGTRESFPQTRFRIFPSKLRDVNRYRRHCFSDSTLCLIQKETYSDPVIMRNRKIHMTAVMNTSVNTHVSGFDIITLVLLRAMLNTSLTAMIHAEYPCAAGKTAIAMCHVKIVVHQIYAAEDSIYRHESVAAFISHTQYLAILCFYHFLQIFTHICFVKHLP